MVEIKKKKKKQGKNTKKTKDKQYELVMGITVIIE